MKYVSLKRAVIHSRPFNRPPSFCLSSDHSVLPIKTQLPQSGTKNLMPESGLSWAADNCILSAGASVAAIPAANDAGLTQWTIESITFDTAHPRGRMRDNARRLHNHPIDFLARRACAHGMQLYTSRPSRLQLINLCPITTLADAQRPGRLQ